MTILLIGLHVIVCLFLIFVVLLQSAQAADLAGAFGGGGSQTALGMRGATTMLHKATTVAALLFMVTSLALGLTRRTESSMIEGLDDGSTPAATSPAPTDQDQGVQGQDGPQSADDSQAQGAAGEQQSGDQDGSTADPQQDGETPVSGGSGEGGSAR